MLQAPMQVPWGLQLAGMMQLGVVCCCCHNNVATYPFYLPLLYEMPELGVCHFPEPVYSPHGLRQASLLVYRYAGGIRNPGHGHINLWTLSVLHCKHRRQPVSRGWNGMPTTCPVSTNLVLQKLLATPIVVQA